MSSADWDSAWEGAPWCQDKSIKEGGHEIYSTIFALAMNETAGRKRETGSTVNCLLGRLVHDRSVTRAPRRRCFGSAVRVLHLLATISSRWFSGVGACCSLE